MNVHVRLFAGARQRVGCERVSIAVPSAATVADLRLALGAAYPQIAGLLTRALFAVDTAYASDDRPLADDMELACIPPVSGG